MILKKFLKKSLIATYCGILVLSPVTAFAEGTEDTVNKADDNYDDYIEGKLTNTFYAPKELFHTSYDYDVYCERMYKEGYMNKRHEWTTAASNYINNPTVQSAEALDENRRELISQRIESGEMLPEENPFLSYDERQDIIKRREEGTLVEGVNNGTPEPQITESLTEPETTDTPDETDETIKGQKDTVNKETDNEKNKENQVKEQPKESAWDIISKVIIALGVIVVVLVGYYIYKRQF